jgi:hypothetical protein
MAVRLGVATLAATLAVVAVVAVHAPTSASAASAADRIAGTARVDAGDDPCVLLSAADVASVLGVTVPEGRAGNGTVGATNQCVYGDPLGFHFRISNTITGDGGKFAKETCGRAKAGTTPFLDYAPVKGVGKFACAYTMGTFKATAPTLVVVAPYRGSKSVGRILTLAVSGTDEQLAPLDARIDPGLVTLGRQAADAVKREGGA